MEQLMHNWVFVPTIAVIGTDRLKERIQSQNNLSLVELLTPFGGYYTPLSVPNLEGFKVRFVDPATPSPSLTGGPPRLFEKWFAEFCSPTNCASGTDCWEQPIGTILMVGSEDPNPVDSFEQLSHVANQSLLCRQGVLDPTSVRIKVLVHDLTSKVPLMSAESILGQLRAMYLPHSVIFLPLNEAKNVEDVKTLFRVSTGLGWEDVTRLNAAVEAIVKENCLPWMERKLAQLEANISAKRKGLRNQLKIFLRAPPNSTTSLVLAQVEWQCRLAGDLSFFLRNYDAAFGYYRSVANELKTDKHTAQAAGCYEMSALSGFLSGNVSVAELTRFSDTAFALFREAKMDTHAIRAAVLQSMILAGRAEAGEKLIAANGEIPDNGIRCAMLLDRAAELHSQAGLKRKAAFTKVLAGHMFNKVEGMKQVALECYRSVFPVYAHGWNFITDHLLFTIAKLEFGLGQYVESLAVLTQLLSTSAGGTPEKHANYIKLLGYIGKSGCLLAPVHNLRLPVFSSFSSSGDEVEFMVHNPLQTPIEVSSVKLRLAEAESEVSGSIVLLPMETRQVFLQVMGPNPQVLGFAWLLNTVACEISDIHV